MPQTLQLHMCDRTPYGVCPECREQSRLECGRARARLTAAETASHLPDLGTLVSLRHSMCLVCYGRAMAHAGDDVACRYCLTCLLRLRHSGGESKRARSHISAPAAAAIAAATITNDHITITTERAMRLVGYYKERTSQYTLATCIANSYQPRIWLAHSLRTHMH